MRLTVLCKEYKTCSTLIWQQPCLLNAQEGQRGQVSVLITALDRVKQAFAQEAPHWQWRAGDFVRFCAKVGLGMLLGMLLAGSVNGI